MEDELMTEAMKAKHANFRMAQLLAPRLHERRNCGSQHLKCITLVAKTDPSAALVFIEQAG